MACGLSCTNCIVPYSWRTPPSLLYLMPDLVYDCVQCMWHHSLTNRCRSSFAPSLWNLHLKNTLPSLKFEVCWYMLVLYWLFWVFKVTFFQPAKIADVVANWSRESWFRGKLISWELILWQIDLMTVDLVAIDLVRIWSPKRKLHAKVWVEQISLTR